MRNIDMHTFQLISDDKQFYNQMLDSCRGFRCCPRYSENGSRAGERAIAVRYSEDESIELARLYTERVDWLWINVNTRLPLNEDVLPMLKPFKVCLVCPERWGRLEDILPYRQKWPHLV